MSMIQVFYATNRVNKNDVIGTLSYGSAAVSNLDLNDPNSGTIVEDKPQTFEELTAWIRSEGIGDVLVFVHGAANSYEDSILRAAYNRNWMLAGGADVAMLVFSWPSRSYDILNLIKDISDYRHDQQQAIGSAPDIAEFFTQLGELKAAMAPRRMSLLAHSMGNYALSSALEFYHGPVLFDAAILAAADEPSDSFLHAGRFSLLHDIAHGIKIYFNRHDLLMMISHAANQQVRIGRNGPDHKEDATIYPRTVYDFEDCSEISDYTNSFLSEPDRSHQYYRQSPTVRANIIAQLKGVGG